MEIREVGPEALDGWSTVPIRFLVRSRFDVAPASTGFVLTEVPVSPPFVYDYDALESPVRWRFWDLTHWGFLEACDGPERVGGTVVAFRTPGLELLEGREDLASLWDLRVRPERRGSGVGRALFDAAAAWARDRGATEMAVETQDINVPACRFYQRQGCRLHSANPGAYEAHPEQVQLLWRIQLRRV